MRGGAPKDVPSETRLLFEDKQGKRRPFLKVKLEADESIIISPQAGVPGLMRSWEDPLRAEVPDVKGLHLSIHGGGVVHVRANGSNVDLETLQVPPLRDFAASSYFLQILPASMETYPEAPGTRATDTVVRVGDVQDRGFSVLVAVGLVEPSSPARGVLPGLDPDGPQRAVRLTRARVGRLEVQAAVAWLVAGELPPAPHEAWALVRLPEGGDHLPRPLRGTQTPSAWDHLPGA